MRALKLVVFGDGQKKADTLPPTGCQDGSSAGTIALGKFCFPELEKPAGIRSRFRNHRSQTSFETSAVDRCARAMEDANPRVLLVVIDARAPRNRRPAVASAHAIASDCLSRAALQTGRDVTVMSVVVQTEDDLSVLARHLDRGHFDPLQTGGLTVVEAERLHTALPSEIQAEAMA